MDEALFIRTPDGLVLTDAGRADIRQALIEYLSSCEIPQGEWQEIWDRAKARGGSNLDLEREAQRWLSDHGRVMVSATSPYVSDETLARVAKRFRRKAIGDDRVNAHLDRLDQRDAQKGAIPPAAPPATDAPPDGPWSLPDSPKRWAKVFGVSSTTIVRWFKAGKVHNKKLNDKKYQVHVGDLPAGYKR